MTKGIIIGTFCFLLFLLHIFIFHYFNIKRRFYAIVKVFLSGLLIYIILFILISEKQTQRFITFFMPVVVFAFLNGAILHLILGYFYLYFIQIIDRTPTARIMIEIENSPEKKLTLEQIKQLYSIDKKISCELEDMLVLGSVSKMSGFYINTTKGRMHMLIFKTIRDYLKLRRS